MTSRLFHQCLMDTDEGAIARDFIVTERHLDPELFRPYEVGFCPPGLLYPDRDELVVDGHMWYMRGRLVFTVRDLSGSIIGFNGRMIPECGDEVWVGLNKQKGDRRASELYERWMARKWVNEEFTKKHHLFRLHEVHRDILETGSAVLVEGCMDGVVMHSFGVTNCVSLLGTALTPIHEGLLKRFAEHLVFCFDSDQAGERTRSERTAEFTDRTPVSGSRTKVGNERNYVMSTSAVVLREGMDPEDALLDDVERPLFLQAVRDLSEKKIDGDVVNLGLDAHRAATMWAIEGLEITN